MSSRATTEQRLGSFYCTRCGREATDVQRSVDERYPLGLCAYTSAKGDPRGCGRVMVSSSSTLAWQMVTARRRREATARHAYHDPAHPTQECDHCRAAYLHRGHVADGRTVDDCPLCTGSLARATPTYPGTEPAGTSPVDVAPEGGHSWPQK